MLAKEDISEEVVILSLVSFVRVSDRSYNALKEAIEKSLKLIDFNFNKGVKNIVIKPNMCYYFHPSTGEVTDPWFVSVLIDVLRDGFGNDPEIFIVESDASAMKCRYAFRMLGYDDMVKKKGVKLVNLSKEKSRVVDIEVDGENFRFYVPELFDGCDFVVNVPKLKYMSDVKITCALKNMYGCNAYEKKFVYHRALDEAIVGINKLIRTNLVVVDGLFVRGKFTKKLNLVMSGTDFVALDAAASRILGFNPRSVRQIVLASRHGMGSLNFVPVGDFSYVMKAFPRKNLKDNLREVTALAYMRIMH